MFLYRVLFSTKCEFSMHIKDATGMRRNFLSLFLAEFVHGLCFLSRFKRDQRGKELDVRSPSMYNHLTNIFKLTAAVCY